jgi:5-methylcytosine-specific restriction protein A
MAAITSKQIHAAFALAGDVYDAKVAPRIAARRLNDETGLNIGSAQAFFVQFRSMLTGVVFKRSLSAEAAEYFLSRLHATRGQSAAEKAVVALWEHIAYYESLGHGRLNKLRSVVAAFEMALPGLPSSEAKAAEFKAAVVASLQGSEASRNARLLKANPIPEVQVVTSRVFRRNPDVVAAVLLRAKGVCEACSSVAPFLRRHDGTPYLEVHHVVLLAESGQDTVENAKALCPNCHRKAHHG